MKIYTKSGDKGSTSLFGGTIVSKDDIQIEAYGTVDELNAFIGGLISSISDEALVKELEEIQPLLFDIGSHLASDGTSTQYLPVLNPEMTETLEKAIDLMTDKLPPLKSFIMPGGSVAVSQAHICRVVCRRAERRVTALANVKEVNSLIIIYLNRLSDYFFVLARYIAMSEGVEEIKWNPK